MQTANALRAMLMAIPLLASTSAFSQAGCYNMAWVSKGAADAITAGSCPRGTHLNGVTFAHALNQNLTYQESFSLTCCPGDFGGFGQDSNNGIVQKSQLVTTAASAQDSAVSGLTFYHPFNQNHTHEEYAGVVQNAALPGLSFQSTCYQQPWASKGALVATSACNRADEYIKSVSYYHPFGQNETYQESVSVNCCAYNAFNPKPICDRGQPCDGGGTVIIGPIGGTRPGPLPGRNPGRGGGR